MLETPQVGPDGSQPAAQTPDGTSATVWLVLGNPAGTLPAAHDVTVVGADGFVVDGELLLLMGVEEPPPQEAIATEKKAGNSLVKIGKIGLMAV